jgi:hypothetical protein
METMVIFKNWDDEELARRIGILFEISRWQKVCLCQLVPTEFNWGVE